MKRGTPRHPKLIHLRQLLKTGIAPAVGHLELLWHFTAEFAPRGDVGRFPDERIEAALHWQGKAGRLLWALAESGWLDHHPGCRLCVHDWAEHADDAVKKRLARSGLQFVQVNRKVTGQRRDTDKKTPDKVRSYRDCGSLPEPEPVPVPVPTTSSTAENASACDFAAEAFDLSDEERAEACSNTNGATKTSLPTPDVETELDQVAQRIHTRHPAVRRCGIGEVKRLLRTIARQVPAAKRIDRFHWVDKNHTAWCASPEWRKDNGQYAKGLDNWLAPTKERWNEPPPHAAGAGGIDPEPPKLMM
jgi:hypothetical protein